jgi:hypothetical protein
VKRRDVRFWLLAPALALGLALVPIPPSAVEAAYSRGVYPWIQSASTLVSNLVPIAVLDLLIGAAVVLTVIRLAQMLHTARRLSVMDAAWDGVRLALRGLALLTIVFVLIWGLNYRRAPLESSVGNPAPPTEAMLLAAVSDANALAAKLRTAQGSESALTYPAVAASLETPMAQALRQLGRPTQFRPGRPKYSLILTPFFTWAGVNGMLNPLGLESIVHPDLLPFERGFVLAHEWAHLAGQADEAAASAIGWLACMKGGPALAYSANLYLILEAGGALPSAARARAFKALDVGVRADLDQISERLRQQRPQVQRAASRVYDEYLKVNRVEDGSDSYGRALTLILSPALRGALDDYRVPARSAD